jgi:hypothetical protein
MPVRILVPHADRAYPKLIRDAEAEAFMEFLNAREYSDLSVSRGHRTSLR